MADGMYLAEKAIRDRLTRILVITGACAGLCYNALWFFPVLILTGGVTTVLWDVWIQQSIGKLRANWTTKRRRGKHQDGDVEEVGPSQSIPLEEHAQVAATTLTQRKAQAEDLRRDASIEPDPAGQTSSANGSAREELNSTEATPIADTTTHNISVKLGIAIIVSFLGTLSFLHPCLMLT
jgi:hypothetical protein